MFPKNCFYKYFLFSLATLTLSCNKKEIDTNDFSAYFGGEVINPRAQYLLFFKDNNVVDTLFIDKNNKFSIKFDSLTPGMYIIKHSDKTKYVFFDKNDSLNLRINTKDFEHASSFYGTGKNKNNFLLELFAFNIDNKNNLDFHYGKNYKKFKRSNDSLKDARTAFYLRRKTEIGWDNDFDLYAQAMLDFEYYSRLEIYPFAHLEYTNENIKDSLPTDYYNFRNKIDFNNEKLSQFKPFTRYLAIMLNSMVSDQDFKTDYEKNIAKIKIVDSLISNQKVKNKILNNIAFVYLLEDQNIENNRAFLKRYLEISTDSTQQNEIVKIKNAINNLNDNNRLPNVELVDVNNKKFAIDKNIHKNTVIVFWTKNAINHYNSSQKKIDELTKSHPEYNFISINIDNDFDQWSKLVKFRNNPNTIELQAKDFSKLKDLWIINRLNRTIILNSDGSIRKVFANIFDDDFQEKLRN